MGLPCLWRVSVQYWPGACRGPARVTLLRALVRRGTLPPVPLLCLPSPALPQLAPLASPCRAEPRLPCYVMSGDGLTGLAIHRRIVAYPAVRRRACRVVSGDGSPGRVHPPLGPPRLPCTGWPCLDALDPPRSGRACRAFRVTADPTIPSHDYRACLALPHPSMARLNRPGPNVPAMPCETLCQRGASCDACRVRSRSPNPSVCFHNEPRRACHATAGQG